MDFTLPFRQIWRYCIDMRFDCVQEFGIERRNQVVVELLFRRLIEKVPGERIDIPRMIQANISEIQRDRAMRLRKGRNVQVRSKGNGRSNGGFAVYNSVLPVHDDLAWCGHHKGGGHW